MRYPCLLSLIMPFHHLVDSGCWMLNLAGFLPRSCFSHTHFQWRFWCAKMLSHPGACFTKALSLAAFTKRGGRDGTGAWGKTGKILCSLGSGLNFPLLPMFSASFASGSVVEIKPHQRPSGAGGPGPAVGMGKSGAVDAAQAWGGRANPISRR